MLLAEKVMVSEKEAKLYKYVSESGSLGVCLCSTKHVY